MRSLDKQFLTPAFADSFQFAATYAAREVDCSTRRKQTRRQQAAELLSNVLTSTHWKVHWEVHTRHTDDSDVLKKKKKKQKKRDDVM